MSAPRNNSVPLRFESERLVIRAPSEQDGPIVHQAICESFDLLHQWMPWARLVPTIGQTTARQADAARRYRMGEAFDTLLLDKVSGDLVGFSGIPRLDWSVPKFEIGYWVRNGYQGRGYITEAVRRITQLAFAELEAKRCEIFCDIANDRSWKVAERAGYKLEGILRNDRVQPNGSLSDTKIYSVVEWSG